MSGEDFDKREFDKRETSQSSSRFGIRDLVSDIDRKIDEKAESLIATELQIPQKIQKILNDGAMEVRINLPEEIKNKSPSDNYYGNGTWELVFDRFTALLKEEGLLVFFTHQGRGGCCRVPMEDKTRFECTQCDNWGAKGVITGCSRPLQSSWCDWDIFSSHPTHPCSTCDKKWRLSTGKVYHSILIKIKP